MKTTMLSLLTALLLCSQSFAKDRATPAADFSGVTSTGEKIKLSAFRGKVVVLDFWASWCGPCRKEFPFLIKLYKEINKGEAQNLEIIAINLDEHSDNMQKFLANLKTDVPFPIVPDPKGDLPKTFKVEGMPTTVFIDKQGNVRFRHVGFTEKDRSKYVKQLNTLLHEN